MSSAIVRVILGATGYLWLSVYPAGAQGFFQQLFGFGASPSHSTPAPNNGLTTPGGRPYTLPGSSPGGRRPNSGDSYDFRPAHKVKTICVRMCDGYYFPISNSTSTKSLYRDQMRCRASCGEEARLFHLPATATDVAEAEDQTGRIYGLLKVAYRYRKGLTPGCQCRPDPWSEAELARHQRYAAVESQDQRRNQQAVAAIEPSEKTIGELSSSSAVGEDDDAPREKLTTAEAPVIETARAGAAVQLRQKPSSAKAKDRALTMRAGGAGQRAHAAKPPVSHGSTMGLGLSSANYRWPGDPPKR